MIFPAQVLTAWLSFAIVQQGITRPVIIAAPKQPAVRAASASPLLPAIPANYLIGAEDVLQVNVWKEPNLSGNLIVRPDGMISLPLIGDLLAVGETPMSLAAMLSKKLSLYVTDPTVEVTLVAVNSKKLYLLGEIQRVGPIMLTPGLTVLQAISIAGGLTIYANSKHIYILRGEVGHQVRLPFNYKKAMKDGNQQGISLAPGDTIVIP